MSWTRVWLPNEMARPNTEAPAMNGVMLMPRLARMVRPAVPKMTTPSRMRRIGARVSSRVALSAWPASDSGPTAPGRAPAALLGREMHRFPSEVGDQRRHHCGRPGAAEIAPGLLVDQLQNVDR